MLGPNRNFSIKCKLSESLRHEVMQHLALFLAHQGSDLWLQLNSAFWRTHKINYLTVLRSKPRMCGLNAKIFLELNRRVARLHISTRIRHCLGQTLAHILLLEYSRSPLLPRVWIRR